MKFDDIPDITTCEVALKSGKKLKMSWKDYKELTRMAIRCGFRE